MVSKMNYNIEDLTENQTIMLTDEQLAAVEGGGPLTTAFKLGYKFGQWLDKKYNLSDRIADYACNLTNCDGRQG